MLPAPEIALQAVAPRLHRRICGIAAAALALAAVPAAAQEMPIAPMVPPVTAAAATPEESGPIAFEADQVQYAYDNEVVTATGNADVAAAVAGAQMGDSLVLSDVIRDYENASRAFSTAMDLVMDTINRDFIARGEALLKTRVVNERAILSGSSAVGRSAS